MEMIRQSTAQITAPTKMPATEKDAVFNISKQSEISIA
jgi:hypothetical protein